jgi:hypothetical protein
MEVTSGFDPEPTYIVFDNRGRGPQQRGTIKQCL